MLLTWYPIIVCGADEADVAFEYWGEMPRLDKQDQRIDGLGVHRHRLAGVFPRSRDAERHPGEIGLRSDAAFAGDLDQALVVDFDEPRLGESRRSGGERHDGSDQPEPAKRH
jgi:hypothetical protein